jgi:hypothetical protein
MLGDIELIFGIRVYNDELHTFRSGPMIFGRVMALGQIFSCHHFLAHIAKGNVSFCHHLASVVH